MDYGWAHLESVLNSLDRENAKRMKQGEPCDHRFEWKEGSRVEMGMDSGYFCRRCGEEQK